MLRKKNHSYFFMTMAGLYNCNSFHSLVSALVIFFVATTTSYSPPHTCKIPTPKGGHSQRCGPCWCTKTRANCSDHKGDLLYVPKLPASIRFLDMSYDNLTEIPVDFFTNVTSLNSVSFSTNFIVNISDGAFVVLKQLEVLIMDNNRHLTETLLDPVFEGKTLKCLDLRFGTLRALPENLYRTPSLEQLFLHDNFIGDLNMSKLETLPNLRMLDWSGNYISQIVPGHMNKLEILDLSVNKISDFPETCTGTGSASYFPRLTSLNLKTNKLHVVRSPLCLPELRRLDLSGNYFQYFRPHTFSSDFFPKLTNLYLETMQGHIHYIDNFTFQNPHLQKISLMFNNLRFSDEEHISSDSFNGCPNMTTLQLSSNKFSGVTDDRFLRLFGNLTTLQNLYLGSADFETITVHTFANFPRLEKLLLYLNKVRSIPDGAFAQNPNLKELQVNDNQLITVTPTTFTAENLERLKWLDLSGNPFVCDCQLRWFREWFVTHKKVFSHSGKPYYCSNLRMKLAAFTMPDQACLLGRGVGEFIVVNVSILIIIGVLISSVFRFRWHIRLLLYEAFRGKGDDRRRQRLEAGNFDYDVFVSYDANDLHWVHGHAMPELEGRLGLKLCVHERDFIPGKNIVDNISDCVERSKKILMVFSRNFVRSNWCQFELAYCLNHVLEHDDALIIVCLGDVASRDLTSTMMAVMKTTVYIQWIDDDQDAIASFWGRIKMALQEVTTLG